MDHIYAQFRDDKTPLTMTHCTIHSAHLHFQGLRIWPLALYFSKCGLLIIFNNNTRMLCAYNYSLNICKYQVGPAMGLGFAKHFTVKSHFTCVDGATESNMFLLNPSNLLI